MITMTVIFLMVLMPGFRRLMGGLTVGIFSVLGLAFMITRDSGGRRRGF